MRVTIRDVAARSGVSANTVSRVLNAKQDVSDATRARVQAVIDELGFRPNNLARSLLRRQSRTIGHVVTDCTNPNTAQQIRAVQNVTTREGYSVVLFDTNERTDRQAESLQLLEEPGRRWRDPDARALRTTTGRRASSRAATGWSCSIATSRASTSTG